VSSIELPLTGTIYVWLIYRRGKPKGYSTYLILSLHKPQSLIFGKMKYDFPL